ncbi:MAG TPA: VOC family protein [Polyangiaceae bacterium]|nr:VOC family protein [Polyangiaceae bacterium]
MLHHLALGARDVERLAGFYARAFGLRETNRHEEGGRVRSIWLELGPGARLMIERSEQGRPPVEGVGAGLFLLAFSVEPQQRVALEQQLEELGSPIESRTGHSSYARDPEGNRIAISCYPFDEGRSAPSEVA